MVHQKNVFCHDCYAPSLLAPSQARLSSQLGDLGRSPLAADRAVTWNGKPETSNGHFFGQVPLAGMVYSWLFIFVGVGDFQTMVATSDTI